MRQRPLGKSGINASIIGLGTWVLGGGSWWGKDLNDAESIVTVQTALDAGINLIDTAPAYGWGRSERIVGKAVKGRRDRVIIATKCGLWKDDARGTPFFEKDGYRVNRCLRPETIQIEVERSLVDLGTDYIDLYQTHWPVAAMDPTPIADTMACLMKLKAQGKIRAIGVSNVSLAELQENSARGEVASDQFRYSMLSRDAEKDILPYSAQNNIATLTYMSLEQGLLAGKVGMDRVFDKDEFRNNPDWNPWYLLQNRKRVLDLLAGWRDLTDKYNCTLAQLVLAWTAVQHGVTHVLCGSRNIKQVLENVKAAELQLAEADVARIRRDIEALGAPALS